MNAPKWLLLAAALAAASSIGSVARAQTMNFGDAVAAWAVACGQDVATQCKGMQPGDSQFAGCIQAKASAACKAASLAFEANMTARFTAQSEAVTVCRQDAQRLCSGFKQADVRLLRCLMKPANFKAATPKCKNTLEAAGWLDEVSVKVK